MPLRTASIADTLLTRLKTQLHLLQRNAMTLTHMHTTGTRLAVATAETRLQSTTGRRLPVLLMVRNSASEVCRATLPKLGYARDKEEVHL
jgi:hypothetical protein